MLEVGKMSINKIYGYARVSSKGQNLDRQIEALLQYGIDKRDIITDKASGKDFNRNGYIILRDSLLRPGDTLVIKELDRLGRNMEMIKEEWQKLIKKGINIIVIDTPILNTKDKSDLEKSLISNIVFELLSYMSEKERLKIKSRQAEGIAKLKDRNNGKGIGRPRIDINTLSQEQQRILKDNYNKWINKEITGVDFMKKLGLKKNSFYKIVKQYKEGQI